MVASGFAVNSLRTRHLNAMESKHVGPLLMIGGWATGWWWFWCPCGTPSAASRRVGLSFGDGDFCGLTLSWYFVATPACWSSRHEKDAVAESRGAWAMLGCVGFLSFRK
jgi:hypothetical protein